MKNLSLIFLIFITACATQIPKPVREPVQKLSLVEAQATYPKSIGTHVRWGGTIANVENNETETLVEIVERPLDSDSRPIQNDQSNGRFLARIDGFIDPAVYAQGREITIIGTVEAPITRAIGKRPYSFVVVNASGYYLWPKLREPLPEDYYYYPTPFWPGPFWYPGYYPYPYYYHR